MVDPLIIYWNQKQWKAFPREIQKAIQDAAEEAGRFEIALCRAGLDGDKSIQILKNEFKYPMEIPDPIGFMTGKGMVVQFLSPAEIQAFAEATAPVIDTWSKEIGLDLINKARADMVVEPEK